MLGKIHSDETKKKMSNIRKGRKILDETKKKISETLKRHVGAGKGQERSNETKKKISKANKGKKRSVESKRKMRLSRLKYIKKSNGNFFPTFNIYACKYFEKFDKENNTKGLYGKNEFHIKKLGYWTDYINFDLKLIVEWDEEHHYLYGKLREKDIQRQKEIENYFPDFKFERIREKNYVITKNILCSSN